MTHFIDGSRLQLIVTELEPAPAILHKFMQCKFKLFTSNPCVGLIILLLNFYLMTQ